MNKLLILLLLSSPVMADNAINNIPTEEFKPVDVLIDGKIVKVYILMETFK